MPAWQPRARIWASAAVIVIRLDVNAEEICAGFGKGLDVAVRLIEHEVRIEKLFRAGAAERGEDFGTKGKIRHEMPVHNIEMEPACSGLRSCVGAGGQVSVIAGEKGRGKEWQIQHKA